MTTKPRKSTTKSPNKAAVSGRSGSKRTTKGDRLIQLLFNETEKAPHVKQDELEAYNMGFEEYLTSNKWIFIEWPEKVLSLLPENRTEIFITTLDSKTRKVKVS